LNTEVEEDMAIPRKKKGDGTYVTVYVKTPTTTLFMGLMKTKNCKTSIEMTEIMVPLVSEQFTMMVEVTTELLILLSAYFAHTVIHNKEYLSFMMNYVNLPPPQTIATAKKR